MNDKETISLLRRCLDSQQRQINEININILPWMMQVEQRVASLQRELEEVYYTKGVELIDNQPKRLKQFHRIVMDEMDLSDESIFYRNGKDRKMSQDDLFARNTLMYMLNKHIPQLTYAKLGVIYGTHFTNLSTEYKKYLNNSIDRQVIDRIDNRISEMIASQRPFDGQNSK